MPVTAPHRHCPLLSPVPVCPSLSPVAICCRPFLSPVAVALCPTLSPFAQRFCPLLSAVLVPVPVARPNCPSQLPVAVAVALRCQPSPFAVARRSSSIPVFCCLSLVPFSLPLHCTPSLNMLLPLTALPLHRAPTLHWVSPFTTLTPSIVLFPPLHSASILLLPLLIFSLHHSLPSIVATAFHGHQAIQCCLSHCCHLFLRFLGTVTAAVACCCPPLCHCH